MPRKARLAGCVMAATIVISGMAGSPSRADEAPRPPQFPHPTVTDARFFPLRVGVQYHYDGTIVDDEGTHSHQVIFTVTDLVKRVDGVLTRVILDEDVVDGVATETELAFFAQDVEGNVWTRGEYPEEYEDGRFAGAPSVWVGGASHAEAGILVPGHPTEGTPRFVQGMAPAIDFFDVGRVVATGLGVCAAGTCYDAVVKIRETAPRAPADGFQLKFYAPRVGLVKVTADGGDSREDLALTSVRHLGPLGTANTRNHALRLEDRAYRISADYRTTGPAHTE